MFIWLQFLNVTLIYTAVIAHSQLVLLITPKFVYFYVYISLYSTLLYPCILRSLHVIVILFITSKWFRQRYETFIPPSTSLVMCV